MKKKLKKEIIKSSVKPEEEISEKKTELFYNGRLRSEYFKSLKEKSMPNQDEIINQDYQKDCLLRHNVIGLPTMTQISEDGTLSLTGYKVNAGLCAALGDFLRKNTH